MVAVAALYLLFLIPAALSKENCEVYEAELKSRPDFAHMVVTSSMLLPPNYIITSVKHDSAKKRSFYWCELKVNDGDGVMKTLRHFGHNNTHWWVTKGCGGWFIITACLHDPTTTAPTNNNVDPTTTPTIVTTTEAPPQPGRADSPAHDEGSNSVSLQFSDLNSGALMSLFSWLRDLNNNNAIMEKLGEGPNHRTIRSVDEEFALEFGEA